MKNDTTDAAYAGYLLSSAALTPQEKGFTMDDTHVELVDHAAQRRICDALGLRVKRAYSFPFPRLVGRVFPYNEFVSIAVTP